MEEAYLIIMQYLIIIIDQDLLISNDSNYPPHIDNLLHPIGSDQS